jgi:putative addiction module component (TIGR02574 family)
MSADTQTIFAQALALPPDVRERLAEELWQSLDGARQQEIQTAWAEEIHRRIVALENGEVQTIPGDQVMRRIRAEVLKK